MAGRKVKKGLDFFPMDINLFSDIKIRKLIKYQGGDAVTIFAKLLCEIYKEGYYLKWDEDMPFILSEATGYSEEQVNESINCFFDVGLFSKKMFDDHRILTSKGIQERYADITSRLKRSSNITEFNLINEEEKYIDTEKIPINSEEINNNSGKIPTIEGKEKVNKKESKEKVKEKHPEKKFSGEGSPVPGYVECVDFWLKHFHPDWQFSAVQGTKMKSIIGKISKSISARGHPITPESISDAFQVMCQKMPEWFRDKDLQVIDQKYNEIIEQIKNPKNGSKNATTKRQGHTSSLLPDYNIEELVNAANH